MHVANIYRTCFYSTCNDIADCIVHTCIYLHIKNVTLTWCMPDIRLHSRHVIDSLCLLITIRELTLNVAALLRIAR